MVCPKCGEKLTVSDTNHIKDTNEIYRLKKCLKCGEKVYTTETIVTPNNLFWFKWTQYTRHARRNRRKE